MKYNYKKTLKKVDTINQLKEQNKYLSSYLKNIRLQIKAEKKILAESQKKYDELHSIYGETLNAPELSARFVERLSFLKDEKYINFVNALVKTCPAAQIDKILSDLMLSPEYIKKLQAQKKEIGKQYYKNLVKINKYSR